MPSFADHELGYVEKKRVLSNLVQTYLATFADIGVETWIMHGSLLGWWWNRKVSIFSALYTTPLTQVPDSSLGLRH